MKEDFLPICREDMNEKGWSKLDIILVSGDAYVDHPSYGIALIGRMLTQNGFKVGIIAQPDWRTIEDFKRLGSPRLFFGITSGNIDSMVANYTANKKLRRTDEYSPGEKAGLRPDRAVIVYANRVREAFKDVPIVLGGIEASLRRLSHYDYWDNRVRRSILCDALADILVYGMGERQIMEIAHRLDNGEEVRSLNDIRGTVVVRDNIASIKNKSVIIPSFEETAKDKKKFSRAFVMAYGQMSPSFAKAVIQRHADQFVIQFPPAYPLSKRELDAVYELPYTYKWHVCYDNFGGVKGLETVRFSITSHRGCCGECSFCALYFHQGRIVQSRSKNSILREARAMSLRNDFRGTITDVGGPTANLYAAGCNLWKKTGFCSDRKCLTPKRCGNLKLGYAESIELYRELSQIPKVKHVFIGSGFRYDLLIDKEAESYLQEICAHHISGLLKVAPEHCSNNVLNIMNKPLFGVYEKFVQIFKDTVRKLKKKIFIVNYFISSHPGSSLNEALKLALYLAKRNIRTQQIQDFIPSPMTLAACIYYIEANPFTDKKVYVPKALRERKMQRALLQYSNPANRKLVVEALGELKALHVLKKFRIKKYANSSHLSSFG